MTLTFKFCWCYISVTVLSCERNQSFINNATSWWSICQSITCVVVLVNENLFLQICGNVIRTLILHICSKDRGITRITNTIRMVLVCSSVLHYYLVWMFWKMLSCELFFMIVFVESMSNCMMNIQFVMIYIILVRYIQVLRWNT